MSIARRTLVLFLAPLLVLGATGMVPCACDHCETVPATASPTPGCSSCHGDGPAAAAKVDCACSGGESVAPRLHDETRGSTDEPGRSVPLWTVEIPVAARPVAASIRRGRPGPIRPPSGVPLHLLDSVFLC